MQKYILKKIAKSYKTQGNAILIQKLTGNQTGSESGSETEIIQKLIGNHSNSDSGYRSLKRLVIY